METARPSLPAPRSLTGVGVSLAVHALLLGAWQLSRPVAVQDEHREPLRVQVLRLLPLPTPTPTDSGPPAHAPAPRAQAPARTRAAEPAAVSPPPETIALPSPVAEAPAAQPSAGELLREARASAGAIDRALRAENPRRGIHAPVETARMKLEKGIAHAAEMAPNRWYQAPKVQEIIDPGQYGRKRYRVVGPAGTYCVTYESNHAPDGIDSMQRGIRPKTTSCPQHEGPAEAQKWE